MVHPLYNLSENIFEMFTVVAKQLTDFKINSSMDISRRLYNNGYLTAILKN